MIRYDTFFNLPDTEVDWHVWARCVTWPLWGTEDEPKGKALNLSLNLCSIPELWP